jgi:hypothetical protein
LSPINFAGQQVWERHPAAKQFSPSGNAVFGQKMTVLTLLKADSKF